MSRMHIHRQTRGRGMVTPLNLHGRTLRKTIGVSPSCFTVLAAIVATANTNAATDSRLSFP